METKVIYREPLGNSRRRYRQENFVISTFRAHTGKIRRGLELCKELGFTMVEFGWTDPEDSLKCMTACEEVGIDGIFQNWECFGGFQESRGRDTVDEEKLAAYLEHTKKYRHVVGYYVWDEPLSDEKIETAARQVRLMEERDPQRLPFTVAIPSYNEEKTWENGKFAEYLRKYTEVISPAVLSLDYYPFRPKRSNAVRLKRLEAANPHQLDESEMFLDLALLRKLSLEKQIPMWFYFQTQDDPVTYGYVDFTPEMVRSQQYNAILHGAVGLQNYNVWSGALTEEGDPGPLFFSTKELNYYSLQMGKTLMALKSVGVFHSPEVLRGRPEFDEYRGHLSESDILRDEDLPFRCSVGEFEDVEHNRYLFVLNRDYRERRAFRLKLKKPFRIYEVSKTDGTQSVLAEKAESLPLTLLPGDAMLLRFQDAEEEAYLIDYVLKL